MKMWIGDTEVAVEWEDNDASAALQELAGADGLEIAMERYGGWEQGGPIGQTLPRQDEQMTAQPGDIMLYSGDQLVVFYGSNSWSYTRLGHITDRSAEELEQRCSPGRRDDPSGVKSIKDPDARPAAKLRGGHLPLSLLPVVR